MPRKLSLTILERRTWNLIRDKGVEMAHGKCKVNALVTRYLQNCYFVAFPLDKKKTIVLSTVSKDYNIFKDLTDIDKLIRSLFCVALKVPIDDYIINFVLLTK